MLCLGSPTTKSLPGFRRQPRQSSAGLPFRVLGQEERDLRLEGVGVLELVHEDEVEALLEVAAHRELSLEDVAGAEEEVGKSTTALSRFVAS